MPLEPRSRLGSYEIVSLLGRGGMGEVYRAHDPKLNRAVAIKVLPDQLSQDSERLGRLRREAQVVAALSHTNIGQIYGVEDSNGVPALVLELVEGRRSPIESPIDLCRFPKRWRLPVRSPTDSKRRMSEVLFTAI